MPSESDLPYRPCVGIMLFNADGKVFVGNRLDQTVESWQMPQGGIDKGETPKEAVLRELKEEVGTKKAETSSSVKASLTKVISGPLSQVTKPKMKNMPPIMAIGIRVDCVAPFIFVASVIVQPLFLSCYALLCARCGGIGMDARPA